MFPALVDSLSTWRDLGTSFQLIVISLLLLVSTLSVADTLGFNLRDLGLGIRIRLVTQAGSSSWLYHSVLQPVLAVLIQLGIAASGLVLGGLALRYLQPPVGASDMLASGGGLAVLALLLAALSQEVFFRGLLQRAAGSALGVPVGIAVTAALFMLLFTTPPLSGALLFTLLLALVSGVVAQVTGSLIGLSFAQTLALVVYFGLLGDPLLCLQGGVDGACLASEWGRFLEGLK